MHPMVLLLFLLHVAAAWVMPDNLQDGHYMVEVGREGRTKLHRRGNGLEHESPILPWLKTGDVLEENAPNPLEDPIRIYDSRHPDRAPAPNGGQAIKKKDRPLRFRDKDKHTDLIPLPVAGHMCDFTMGNLPLWEYSESREGLRRFCDRYLVPRRTIHLAVSANGTAAAFVCNYSRSPQVCSIREFQWIERHWLDMRCGPGYPGQVWAPLWKKWYGRAFPGMHLCHESPRLEEHAWHGYPNGVNDPYYSDDDVGEEDDGAFIRPYNSRHFFEKFATPNPRKAWWQRPWSHAQRADLSKARDGKLDTRKKDDVRKELARKEKKERKKNRKKEKSRKKKVHVPTKPGKGIDH